MPSSINLPIHELTSEAAASLSGKHVVVLNSRDTRSLQACVRLARVFKLNKVDDCPCV